MWVDGLVLSRQALDVIYWFKYEAVRSVRMSVKSQKCRQPTSLLQGTGIHSAYRYTGATTAGSSRAKRFDRHYIGHRHESTGTIEGTLLLFFLNLFMKPQNPSPY